MSKLFIWICYSYKIYIVFDHSGISVPFILLFILLVLLWIYVQVLHDTFNPIRFTMCCETHNLFPGIYFMFSFFLLLHLPSQCISCFLLYFHKLCLLYEHCELWTVSDGCCHHILIFYHCSHITSFPKLFCLVYLEWIF